MLLPNQRDFDDCQYRIILQYAEQAQYAEQVQYARVAAARASPEKNIGIECRPGQAQLHPSRPPPHIVGLAAKAPPQQLVAPTKSSRLFYSVGWGEGGGEAHFNDRQKVWSSF